MPIAACSSGVRLTWVLVAEWHTSVSGPPSDVAGRAMRRRVDHRPGGVDAAGEVDGEHRRQARAAGASPARAGGGRAGRGGGRRRRPGGRRSALGDAQGDVGLVALAHGERADAAQPVERVVRRRRWRRAARRRPRSRRAGRARRRRRRAWRRCGRRCPSSPSAARGRRRGASAAGRSAWRTSSRRP